MAEPACTQKNHSNTEQKQTDDEQDILTSIMTEATDYKEGGFADEPSTDTPTKVHIIAPSTLPEGYAFEVEVGPEGAKKTINAEVVR